MIIRNRVEILYFMIALIAIFFLFKQIKIRYFTKILQKFIENFEVSYIKSLRERLERTAEYSYQKINKDTDFKKIYQEHFNKILISSQNYIDEYELNFRQKEEEYQFYKRTIYSITKLMKNFNENEVTYLIRLLELLKYDGEHYFDDFQDIKLFSGKEIKEIKEFIEYFFIIEILKNDFKYIGELRKIIVEMEIEYKLKSEDGHIYYSVDILDNILQNINLIGIQLSWAIDKTTDDIILLK